MLMSMFLLGVLQLLGGDLLDGDILDATAFQAGAVLFHSVGSRAELALDEDAGDGSALVVGNDVGVAAFLGAVEALTEDVRFPAQRLSGVFIEGLATFFELFLPALLCFLHRFLLDGG